MKCRISIITNVIPSYREGFYNSILANNNFEITIYCQSHIPGLSLNLIHEKFYKNVHLVNFISTKGESISWQFLPFFKLFKNSDIVFIDGNPRCVSNFLFSTFLLIAQKKVVLWTMAHSFQSNQIRERLRLFWSKFFKYLFVYTDDEVKYLKTRGFTRNLIIGMNNGLDQKNIDEISSIWNFDSLNKWKHEMNLSNKILLLSCARLIPKNDFQLFVFSLPIILNSYPNVVWCIIGDGESRSELEIKCRENNVLDNVRFLGSIYNVSELAPWFLSSSCLIHPAALGLSIFLSFGFGLPVITHNLKDLHGPEYSAFDNGINGLNYNYGDYKDLAFCVLKLLNDKDKIENMKFNCFTTVRENYNVNIMAKRFFELVEIISKNKE